MKALKWNVWVLLLTLLPSITACASTSGGPVDGVVLEAGTNKPIADAIVVVRWTRHMGYSGTICYHVESATTDVNGKYHVPKWTDPSDRTTLYNPRNTVSAYKRGYGLPAQPSQKPENVLLAPFTGTRAERFDYLVRLFGSSGCSADKNEKSTIPFVKALYDETKEIAQTQEELRMLESILYGLEKLELGFEEAQKRHLERAKK